MVNIEIDGKKYQSDPGKMIIEVADEHDVKIPRFCYHKKLSVVANCRMCLVEVEKSGKPLPACATPVTDGMKVYTQSQKALDAQKIVMEFLLINHPLDCPICDQGGECELQDVSMGYGGDVSRYNEGKRVVDDEDIGPLIATDMTRCIHCTRCVRFGEEIAGVRELGATGRGENMRIGTFIKHAMTSEVSGNIIDLCPVGALTSKPFRFRARAWELDQAQSIAPHDCIGSNIHLHTLRQKVMRVVPKDNEDVNETWISDRDRFSYTALSHADRIGTPKIKRNGQWVDTDWTTALKFAVEGLQKVIKQDGVDQIAGLASPSSTTEELFLFQKLLRGIGIKNIDHRLRQVDMRGQENAADYPGMALPLEQVEKQNAILLLGSNIQREQPILGLKVRKASLLEGTVSAINVIDYDYNFDLENKVLAHPNNLVARIAQVVKALVEKGALDAQLASMLEDVQVEEHSKAIAEQLESADNSLIILGAVAHNHPQASQINAWAQILAKLTKSHIAVLTDGANSAGAYLAGAVPHRQAGAKAAKTSGLSAIEAINKHLKAYVLLGVEPELDCANSAHAFRAMNQADFVVALSSFESDSVKQYANVMLPIAAFTETSGNYINVNGLWQSFKGIVNPFEQARPAWKVLRVLGNLFEVDGFEFVSSEEVLNEMKGQLSGNETSQVKQVSNVIKIENQAVSLVSINEWPIYVGDALVRRSKELRQSGASEIAALSVNAKTASSLQLQKGEQALVQQGEFSSVLPVVIDQRIPDNAAYIPNGFTETVGIGESFKEINISKT